MVKILLVEDNEMIIKGLSYSLQQEGFFVDSEKTVHSSKEKLERVDYDLILLDISLPDGNGFEVCSYIKEKKDTPVIFLTARDEETNVVLGLDMGADDYIIKPFRMRELISRIHTVLRRYHKNNEENSKTIKNIRIDLNKAQVWKEGKQVELTALEYKILVMLFQNQGRIMTREQILDKIWDIAGNFVNDNTLTVYIKRIREKIEEDPVKPQIIKTVRGIGYKIGE